MRKPIKFPIALDDVKSARAYLDESQENFGKHFGVKQPTVLRWERDGLPTAWQYAAVRERIAEFIEVLNRKEMAKTKKKAKSREFA